MSTELNLSSLADFRSLGQDFDMRQDDTTDIMKLGIPRGHKIITVPTNPVTVMKLVGSDGVVASIDDDRWYRDDSPDYVEKQQYSRSKTSYFKPK